MLSPQEALQEWLVIITVVISEKMMPESCFSGLLSFAKLRKKGLSFRENSRRIKNKTRADRGNSLRGKCGRKEGMILYARKVKEERMGQNWDKERSRDQQQPVTSEFCPMERPERETYTVAGWGRVWRRGGATTIGRILNKWNDCCPRPLSLGVVCTHQ